jgi:hypothetical protein
MVTQAVVVVSLAGLLLQAQPGLQVQKAELALPFGAAEGKLLTVGDYLVFVDDGQPDASFAVARREVKNIRLHEGVITLELSAPVRDRSGERSQVSLRMASASALDAWYQAKGEAAGAGAASGSAVGEGLSYQATHSHFLRGECGGKLMITAERVIYESVSNAGHSRQWQLSDIKEVQLKNPYEIELKPFTGDSYSLKLVGQGMDSADHQKLVDRIVKARVGRQD